MDQEASTYSAFADALTVTRAAAANDPDELLNTTIYVMQDASDSDLAAILMASATMTCMMIRFVAEHSPDLTVERVLDMLAEQNAKQAGS